MYDAYNGQYEHFTSGIFRSQVDAFKAIQTLFKTKDIVSLTFQREPVNGTGYFSAMYKRSEDGEGDA